MAPKLFRVVFSTIEMYVLICFAYSLQIVAAMVKDDYNCSAYFTEFASTPDPWRWTSAAEYCVNTFSDAACLALYPRTLASDPPPNAGEYTDRPKKCYSSATAAPYTIDENMKAGAIAGCARHCGYCCQTDAGKCSNVQFPRLNCATITRAQCESVVWRSIIAQDCPRSCGFCNLGGCVDAVTNCANDLSICTTVGMQDFVNQYCQRTCNRCPSSTTASSSAVASSATCTSFIPNTSAACAAWAANGFCTNAFYTLLQRKAYCATTCRLC